MIDNSDSAVIYHTLIAFFLLNACFSAVQFISIVIETGAINPFRYQGDYQKYFISTGDYIKGISLDTSTTNAILNAFGIIFFLWKRNWALVLICTGTLLLTGSNLVNLVLFPMLLFLFIFNTTKEQKSIIVICCALLVVFMAKVSPQNNQYVTEIFAKIFPTLKKEKLAQAKTIDVRELPDSHLTSEQKKEKIALVYLDSLNKVIVERKRRENPQIATWTSYSYEKKPLVPEPNIHSAPFQNRDDTNSVRKELLAFISAKKEFTEQEQTYAQTNFPGKAIAYLQTGRYLSQHPHYLITGAGLGNFSSKMAFKATALQFAGGFPVRLAYIHPDFSFNHLSLYLYFFSKRAKSHSVVNSPNSVYDQLMSEYGIIGLGAFLLFYVGFFLKQYKKLTYGIPLLLLLLSFFFIDYWFEQLSIVVVFELLLFLNLKESRQET
ncbi:MAG: hypothetical protein M3342_20165 [Bacteroidota bacterium]|nr:hypothetical protein [Bacteroidota bacterium]